MEIRLKKDTEQRLVASLRRYFAEELGEEIGELKAALFLQFCLREIGPCIYNQAIADAQAYMLDRAGDLENVCFAEEFRPGSAPAPRPRGPRR